MVVLACAVPIGLCASEIYRWVDENGVVHYTDTAPEDQTTTEIEISEPPTAAERKEAEAIYRQAIEQSRQRQLSEQDAPASAESARQEKNTVITPGRIRCYEAYLAIQDLESRGDVYKDEAGRIHSWNSLHSFWYESYRKRLNDSEKRDHITKYLEEMDRYCDLPQREIRKRSAAWKTEQSKGECPLARAKLERIRGGHGKTPLGTVEEIEELIGKYCQ